jgi:hypothetical protein
MNIHWEVTEADKTGVRQLVRTHRRNPFVQNRIARNVKGNRPRLTKSVCWHAMVSCQLTTQQRSGPDSPVSRLIAAKPFPLSYRKCREARRLTTFVPKAIRDARGIRRGDRIGEECSHNLAALEGGLWGDLLGRMKQLTKDGSPAMERETARFVSTKLKGFGPKQSRNLLQSLGLTKYEIPLDSRITKWLNAFGFPLTLTAAGLQDENYYCFILDGVLRLCRACRVFPCVLDACIFVSFDTAEWKPGKIVW